jgi:hypothetical protein
MSGRRAPRRLRRKQRNKLRYSALHVLAVVMIVAACGGSAAMSQTPDVPDRQEFLDRNFPFIEQGQAPPGRYAPSEKLQGRLVWQGPGGCGPARARPS